MSIKKSATQITFSGLPPTGSTISNGEESKTAQAGAEATEIEFLPCLFQKNVDESNKAIYFDPIKKDAELAHVPKGAKIDQIPYKQVSLHGRRMIGLSRELPSGYRGYVFERVASQQADQIYYGQQKVPLELHGEFSATTEWRKDQWQAADDTYPKSLLSYLECSAILNSED